MKNNLKRRAFLAGSALSGASLAALGLTRGGLTLPSLAHAQDAGSAPRRLIVVATQHGTWYPTWRSRLAGRSDDERWTASIADFSRTDFGEGLRPLHRHRDQLSIVDGLGLVSGEAEPGRLLRHEIGQVHALTGAWVDMVAGWPVGSAPSIDQLVADQIARPDRFRSLEIGVGAPPFSVNYRGPRQTLPYEGDPALLYRRLFGLVNGGNDASQLGQASVLDQVGARYEEMEKRLSGDDRVKLETHKQLVRELETRVTGLSSVSCETPDVPTVSDDYEGEYANHYSAFVQMVTAAMSCDLVRVVTMHLGDIPGEELGYSGEGLHDEHAHNVFESERSQQVMTDYSAYHAAQMAELMDALAAVPEGDGTLLDHTLVVWAGELADGAHGFEKWPAVIGGGSRLGTGYQPGQYVHYPSDVPVRAWAWTGDLPTMGQPHQKLLSTVGRALGLENETGGAFDRMPITEVTGTNGEKVDCTGIVEELFA